MVLRDTWKRLKEMSNNENEKKDNENIKKESKEKKGE